MSLGLALVALLELLVLTGELQGEGEARGLFLGKEREVGRVLHRLGRHIRRLRLAGSKEVYLFSVEGPQGLLDWREVFLLQGEELQLEVSLAERHVGGLTLPMNRQEELLDVNWAKVAKGEATEDDL